MNQTNRLILYLVINIIVSAATILTVLWIWDRPTQPLQNLLTGGQASAAQPAFIAGEQTAMPAATAKPTRITSYPEGLITIANVIGTGSLQDERVTIQRQGEGELSLAGWILEDTDGNAFTFPELTLYKDGAIILHSSAGMNTVIDLYWNRSDAVWQSGEKATLRDPLGKIQFSYKVP